MVIVEHYNTYVLPERVHSYLPLYDVFDGILAPFPWRRIVEGMH